MREWLKEFRDKKGLTQEELANSIEISRPYYTEIEKGLKNPSVKVAKRIASNLEFEWTIFLKTNDTIRYKKKSSYQAQV